MSDALTGSCGTVNACEEDKEEDCWAREAAACWNQLRGCVEDTSERIGLEFVSALLVV